MRGRADSIRQVRVAGDAAARKQAIAEANDKVIKKGSRVSDIVFGARDGGRSFQKVLPNSVGPIREHVVEGQVFCELGIDAGRRGGKSNIGRQQQEGVFYATTRFFETGRRRGGENIFERGAHGHSSGFLFVVRFGAGVDVYLAAGESSGRCN
jgi:hypothetical protein